MYVWACVKTKTAKQLKPNKRKKEKRNVCDNLMPIKLTNKKAVSGTTTNGQREKCTTSNINSVEIQINMIMMMVMKKSFSIFFFFN